MSGRTPLERVIDSREADGLCPGGERFWRFTEEERATLGRAHPKAWRIDWQYVVRGGGALQLLTAGGFHYFVERENWLRSPTA